jgi:hypothetical protein
MTVKKEKTKQRGRPPGDPDDVRTERIAIRVHPNLLFELNVLSRVEGVTRSVLVERLLIRLVNDHHRRTLMDPIGRYVDGPPEIIEPGKGVEFLRRERMKKTPPRRQPITR